MIPMLGGGLTNSGSMPISGGQAGPSTATSTNNSGQSIGAINMGSPTGVSPLLIAAVVVILAFLVLRKK
ncbi:hypothetical protein [Vibrio fluvialis]|uniref:hypothetical protein n=1 Tax=Vibrio fluvialis TaxID=676 RepID=UPI00155893DF|nr:hypothetical protein [Vibrio fluvialis]EKO3904895.1 hypothetical protein [Vibrio fluvialis]EKO3957012.1 hypothetical protein [Vibrio fluvialis]EKO4002943.1 hypothetical protein [Vibrio fluvialis]ELO1812181.1 hypothetical protein [Vibrio fluvialis]ELV8850517.1 hypothetical protein [Vibrio fluvialis]